MKHAVFKGVLPPKLKIGNRSRGMSKINNIDIMFTSVKDLRDGTYKSFFVI